MCLKRQNFLYSDPKLLLILLDLIFSATNGCHFVISHPDHEAYSAEHTVFGYPSPLLDIGLEVLCL